jgi:uncharacterized metal-binding protein
MEGRSLGCAFCMMYEVESRAVLARFATLACSFSVVRKILTSPCRFLM